MLSPSHQGVKLRGTTAAALEEAVEALEQAVKQANISTEADNRKKKVASAAKGKAAKPAPRKAGAVKSKSKPAGKPKKK